MTTSLLEDSAAVTAEDVRVLALRLDGIADRIGLTPVQLEDALAVRQAADLLRKWAGNGHVLWTAKAGEYPDPHPLNTAGCCDGRGQVHHGFGALSYVTLCRDAECVAERERAWAKECGE